MKALFPIAALLCATSAAAAPADTIRSRVSGLRELGAAMKAANDGLKSDEPQTILIQQSARQIRNAANQMPGWFPAGTGPEAGVKTSAKPEIWTQAVKFKASLAAFSSEAAKFQTVAASGDAVAMKAAARSLALTCKGCHDSFRVPGN